MMDKPSAFQARASRDQMAVRPEIFTCACDWQRIRISACKEPMYHDLNLAPWEAVLGTTVSVPMPDGGRVKVQIPPGTNNGKRLGLRSVPVSQSWAGAQESDRVRLSLAGFGAGVT